MVRTGWLYRAGFTMLIACAMLGGAARPMPAAVAHDAAAGTALHLAPSTKGSTATAYYAQGLAKLRAGDYAGAIDAFTHAIALNPKYAPAYEERANAYVHLKRLGA